VYQPFASSPYVTVKQQPRSPFLQPPAVPLNAPHRKFPIPSTPAVESNQRAWWALFLEQYAFVSNISFKNIQHGFKRISCRLNDIVADLSYLCFTPSSLKVAFLY
jgi:hypothetical protein